MIELRGKYNQAKVYTDNVEETAVGQIIELCNQETFKDSQIRIMSDVHAGAGCTIGTTMTITDKVVPSLVGVDIGCGMLTVKLGDQSINFDQLDEAIRKYVPSGMNIRNKSHANAKRISLEALHSASHLNLDRAKKSIGTLGGGNHFIEVNQDKAGHYYLVIHSGSRNLGKQVAEYYQNLAYERLTDLNTEKQALIAKLRAEGREKDIQKELSRFKPPQVKKDLAWLEGEGFQHYIDDMKLTQHYAVLNRQAMANVIVEQLGLTVVEEFTTIHNYIDTEHMILRKGAISAREQEVVLIPLNMRDGSLICIGKGNSDWNYSAPHGAGRLMSRGTAKQRIGLEEFQNAMKGIWSTSVRESTLDESPMAYKPAQEIIDNVQEAVTIVQHIKPVYNFKAS
jgi:RNA-splicing ligase RtcB